MAHGEEKAKEAAETARKTFEQGDLAEGLPTVEMDAAELDNGLGLLTALVKAGLASSNGEARRHIKGGAVSVNDERTRDERQVLHGDNISDEGVIKLSVGKKRHVLLKII